MTLFLLIFILSYSGLQAVIYLRILPLLPPGPVFRGCVMLWLALMVLAPILTHLLDHALLSVPARVIGWTGYSWMGFSFLAFCLSLASFAFSLIWFLAGKIVPALPPTPAARQQALAVLLLTLGLTLWAAYTNRGLTVNRITLFTPKLECGTKPLRVVLISDLHLGLMAGERAASEIVARIRSESPDLVLCAGDLVDGNLAGLDELARCFQGLTPRLGKYAVTGNHETYLGLERAAGFFRRGGFVLLRDETVDLGENITLVGLDYRRNRDLEPGSNLLNNLDGDRFSLLLNHTPLPLADRSGLIDLQLSGHTHKGQIFPFSLVVGLSYPYLAGMHMLEQGGRLYVSQGTGSWGPRMRLGTRREIALIKVQGDCRESVRR